MFRRPRRGEGIALIVLPVHLRGRGAEEEGEGIGIELAERGFDRQCII